MVAWGGGQSPQSLGGGGNWGLYRARRQLAEERGHGAQGLPGDIVFNSRFHWNHSEEFVKFSFSLNMLANNSNRTTAMI